MLRLNPIIYPSFINESGAQRGAVFWGFLENRGNLASKLRGCKPMDSIERTKAVAFKAVFAFA